MQIAIADRSTDLAVYASIPIAFSVTSVIDLTRLRVGAPRQELHEIPLAQISTKDYDALPGNGPTAWPTRFDLRHWAFALASHAGRRVGGATVVVGAPDVDLCMGREDHAILWDIRVAPGERGQGIGAGLLAAAVTAARTRDARHLRVETQQINVAACRFYQRMGFLLEAINRDAYPDLPDEVQLLWGMDLTKNSKCQ